MTCVTAGCVGVCVNLTYPGYPVVIVDTKNPEQPGLAFRADEWWDFVAAVKGGEFDVLTADVKVATALVRDGLTGERFTAAR